MTIIYPKQRLSFINIIGLLLLASTTVSVVCANEPPSNNVCSSAAPLVIAGSDGDDGAVVTGTTQNATVDEGSSVCLQRGDKDGESPGVWYSVVGTGIGIRVYSCTDIATERDVLSTASMTLYDGDCSSNQLHCLSVSTEGKELTGWCSTEGQVISWLSVKDVTYYLLVRGTSAQDIGSFSLEVRALPSLANHDVCSDALLIVPMDGRFDDRIGGNRSSIDLGVGCPSIAKTPRTSGLWYQFKGTGQTIRVAPPCGGFAFDVTVTLGVCGQETCAGTREKQNVCGPEWGDENVVVVDTLQDQLYYILVQITEASTVASTSFYLQFKELSSGSSGPSSKPLSTSISFMVATSLVVVFFLGTI